MENVYLFVGAILLLYSPIAALLLRSHPEDIGLKPDGDDAQVRDHSSESAPSNVKRRLPQHRPGLTARQGVPPRSGSSSQRMPYSGVSVLACSSTSRALSASWDFR